MQEARLQKVPRMTGRTPRRPKKTRALARVMEDCRHRYFLNVREPPIMALIMLWRDMTSSRKAA